MTVRDEARAADEEAEPVLPDARFVFEKPRAALVVIDPQNDFLSPAGAGWPVFGQSVTDNNTVANLAKLFAAAESNGMTVSRLAALRVSSRWGMGIRGPRRAAHQRTSHVRTVRATDC